MKIYLRDIPLPEAQAIFERSLKEAGYAGTLHSESIPLDENALGRVLREGVWAKISSPHYHAAAMDGFAIQAETTVGADLTHPITLLCDRQTVYVDTGDMLPEGMNAVIPIEQVESLSAEGSPATTPRAPYCIRLRAAVTPWSCVRPMGEDIVATQLVLPGGQVLRPVDLGALAACGHDHVMVVARPRIAILPSGSELVPIGVPVQAGKIIEYNSLVLAAQVNAWGGEAERYPITPDIYEELREQVRQAAQKHDLILLNAGSSAGAEDFSAQVIASLGEVLVHGVAVRPGHPVILGMISTDERKVPIVGVPGYPVSAALTAEIFVRPLIERWSGKQPVVPEKVSASLTRKINSPAGDDDYVRVAVGRVRDKLLAAPLARGAGVITSLVKADGLLVIPRGVQGLPAGEQVTIDLIRSSSELEKTIFTIGSHDITLDVMAQYLADRDRRLVSANVGSLGGLMALQRGEAHMAGSHLLDPQSGEYNLSYVRQICAGIPVIIIALVNRQQGLIVCPGNPKKITEISDLVRPEVTFINRQRGAGTRVLLDYHLSQLNISAQSIHGYAQEEYTHLAVAAAVASGRADCGLGIAAAAQALAMDFIPLYQERYDLVIPTEFYHSRLLAPVLDMLADTGFRKAVTGMVGYDVEPMGRVIAELEG